MGALLFGNALGLPLCKIIVTPEENVKHSFIHILTVTPIRPFALRCAVLYNTRGSQNPPCQRDVFAWQGRMKVDGDS
jgi:hypothetical protein